MTKENTSIRNRLFDLLPWRIKGFLGGRPSGQITSIEELGRTNKVTFVASGAVIQLPKPITFSENLNNTFNENFSYPSPSLYCAELELGRVFRHNNLFSIIDQNNHLVKDLSFDPLLRKNHPVFSEAFLPKAKWLKGKTLMLATLGAETVYFHWILDLLPRINISQKAGYLWEDFDQILINPFNFDAQMVTLEKLNVPKEKLCFLKEYEHYKCEKLVVPSLIFHNPSSIKFLRRSFMNTCINNPKERIFLIRTNPTWRKILNHQDVLTVLNKFGFKTIDTESLTFDDQVSLFNNAEIIVSVHGAGLANLVFGNPGSTVIELIADWHKNVDYWISASYSQMNYHLLGCTSNPSHAELGYAQSQNYNIVVNIQDLEQHIQLALKKAQL